MGGTSAPPIIISLVFFWCLYFPYFSSVYLSRQLLVEHDWSVRLKNFTSSYYYYQSVVVVLRVASTYVATPTGYYLL